MKDRIHLFYLCLFLAQAFLARSQETAGTRFRHMSVVDSGFIGYYYAAGCEDAMGYMWFGGRTGLVRYDGSTLHAMNDILRLHLERHTMIRSIIRDRNDNLWISNSDVLFQLNPQSLEFARYPFNTDTAATLASPDLETVLEDRTGHIWVTGRYGIYLYQPDSGTFENYRFHHEGLPEENGVITMVQDPVDDEVFWLGTNLHGVQRFDLGTGEYEEFLPSKSGLYTSYTKWLNAIWGLHVGNDGYVWVYTADKNDLLRLDPLKYKWTAFPLQSERMLRSNSVACGFDILEVSDSTFIISTNTGIGEFNRLSGKYYMFEMEPLNGEGLLASFCRNIVPDRYGRLWFPQQFGISFTTAPVLSTQAPRTFGIALEELRVLENNRDVHPTIKNDSIHLFANERSLRIGFAVPNAMGTSDVQYCYRIQGESITWTCFGDSSSVILHNLKPGITHMEYGARSSVADPENTRMLAISVEAAFWEKTGFRIALVVILLGLVFGYYQLRIRQIRKEARLKERYTRELSEVQLLALRSQMNPHFLFNTINSINHFILKNNRQAASAYLGKFSRLMRQVLQNSQSDMLTLQQELEAMQLYVELEQLRYDDKFGFTLEVDPGLDPAEVLIPPLVIQPFLENAIWHGLSARPSGGELYLGIGQSDALLHITIRDNGIGREAARVREKSLSSNRISLGSALARDRVGVISKLYEMDARVETIDLHTDDGSSAGTKVHIQLPLIRSRKDVVGAGKFS